MKKHLKNAFDPAYTKYTKIAKFFTHVGLSGLTFRKDLYLASNQIYPPLEENKKPLTRLQERLIKKLGEHAHPFYFELPPHWLVFYFILLVHRRICFNAHYIIYIFSPL